MKKKQTIPKAEGISLIRNWSTKKKKYIEPPRPYAAVRYVTIDGRRTRETECFASFQEAKAWRATTAEYITQAPMTLRELKEKYFAVFKGEISTRQKLENHLRAFESIMDCPVKDITLATIDELLSLWRTPEYLETQKQTRFTFENELRALRQVLRYFQSRIDHAYRLPFLPEHWEHAVVRRQAKKVERAPTIEEMARVFDEMERDCAGTPYAEIMPTILRVQFLLFARISEIAALHFEDIDRTTNTVTLNKRIMYLRRGEQRAVLADGLKASEVKAVQSRMAVELLLAYCMKRGIRSGPLFLVDGKPVSYRMIQYRYDKAFRLAGVAHSGTHIIRHASLTQYQKLCGNLVMTKEMAGHSSIKMTERYLTAVQDDLARTQERMEDELRARMAADKSR